MTSRTRKGRVSKVKAASRIDLEAIKTVPLEVPLVSPPQLQLEPQLEHEGPMIEQMIEQEHEKPRCVLRWEEVNLGGNIPANAVEGGWRQDTKEPLYIARGSFGNALIPGFVQKSDGGRFSCSNINLGLGSFNSFTTNYEVLVNPNKATLNWVSARSGNIPSNAFEGGYLSPGRPAYIGRHGVGKKDIVPGCIDSSTGILTFQYKYKQNSFKEFQVLVAQGDVEIIEQISQCSLNDITYNMEQADVMQTPAELGETVFKNHSSLEQQFSSSIDFEDEKTYFFDTGSKTDYMVDITGGIPYTHGRELAIEISPDGQLDEETEDIIVRGGVLGKNNPQIRPHHLLGYTPMLNVPLNTGHTNVKMKLGDILRLIVNRKENVQVKVPSKSQIEVKIQAKKVILVVPFTAKLKKVYKNGMIAEEDISGTFRSSRNIQITPVILKDEKIKD